MLRKVYTETIGHFPIVVEDDEGRLCGLTGMTRTIMSKRFRAELDDVEIDLGLIDPSWKGIIDPMPPRIQDIAPASPAIHYVATIENGDRLELSPQELKTLLDAPQPTQPLA